MSITQIDANGRVLLPLGIRYHLDLNDGDKLAVDELGDGTIILKKLDKSLCFQDWINEKRQSRDDSFDCAFDSWAER